MGFGLGSNGSDKNLNDEEEEKYNQEMFLKMKAESERNQSLHANDRPNPFKRRGSSGSSDEEDQAAEDMGLFGY